jgi:hypothetical protein
MPKIFAKKNDIVNRLQSDFGALARENNETL